MEERACFSWRDYTYSCTIAETAPSSCRYPTILLLWAGSTRENNLERTKMVTTATVNTLGQLPLPNPLHLHSPFYTVFTGTSFSRMLLFMKVPPPHHQKEQAQWSTSLRTPQSWMTASIGILIYRWKGTHTQTNGLVNLWLAHTIPWQDFDIMLYSWINVKSIHYNTEPQNVAVSIHTHVNTHSWDL